MSTAVFVKRYDEPGRCAAAAAHHAWLAALDTEIRLPRLLGTNRQSLAFEFLPGRAAAPEDLARLATVIGRLDAAAYRRHLHAAHLRQPYHSPGGPRLADFVSPRRAALRQAATGAGLRAASMSAIIDRLAALPAALYKDANPRNFLVTADDIAVVDFDDLTLAPFGYDLAKLVVTTAMTYGSLHPGVARNALDLYNTQIRPLRCDLDDFSIFTEIHHLLTARYLGSSGYRYPWPAVRPWPEPAALAT